MHAGGVVWTRKGIMRILREVTSGKLRVESGSRIVECKFAEGQPLTIHISGGEVLEATLQRALQAFADELDRANSSVEELSDEEQVCRLHAALSEPIEAIFDHLSTDRSGYRNSSNITTRVVNRIHDNSVSYVGDLVRRSQADLLRWKHIGRGTIRSIEATLEKFSKHRGVQLALGMDVRGWQAPKKD